MNSLTYSLFALIFLINESTCSSSLGSFCNAIDGCGSSSLTCLKNQCECAPGYAKNSSISQNECQFIGCQTDGDCQGLDTNRKCNQINNKCDQCKNGLILDPTVNRCVTLLGYGCVQSTDCWNFGSNLSSSNLGDFDSLPICRSARCVCRTNYFPTSDWSQCEPRNCSTHEECNPFGDDPHRYCSKSRQTCLCALGYYENEYFSVCLPYVPIQYSLMMPFWLMLIMFTVCILVYVSRRLARARAEDRARAAAAAANSSNGAEEEIPHVLNLPPPSYETIVKEPVESQPPNYSNIQA